LRPWLDPGVDLTGGQSASELDGLDQQMARCSTSKWHRCSTAMTLLDERFLFVLDQAMVSCWMVAMRARPFPEFGHGTLVAGVIHTVAPGKDRTD
jgi:hypothetical protein